MKHIVNLSTAVGCALRELQCQRKVTIKPTFNGMYKVCFEEKKEETNSDLRSSKSIR